MASEGKSSSYTGWVLGIVAVLLVPGLHFALYVGVHLLWIHVESSYQYIDAIQLELYEAENHIPGLGRVHRAYDRLLGIKMIQTGAPIHFDDWEDVTPAEETDDPE